MAMECALFYNDGGQRQGTFTGENFAGGELTDSSVIIEVRHGVESPTDTHTGLSSGKRRHDPLKVLKQTDKATINLYNALVVNETLIKLDLKWYRPSPTGDGTTQHFLTTTIENARVVKLESVLPNTKDRQLDHLHPQEWVHFVYQKITWTWMDGNAEATDSWVAPS